ncbi:MAG: LptF/LptG family permease [Phycisphaerales bacterium]|jgi:lipopolysaccharide export system permease protein|nr:LptF/LptG family permease [Phycisphaerales bacterium]
MNRIDRYIVGRVLLNFVLLFAVLYLFAATIDVILNLDEFTQLATIKLGEDSSWFWNLVVALGFAVNFHLPQVFQFYAWLYGVVTVGAVCFSLAQMSRYRELVSIVASGVSLRRIALPFIAVSMGLGVLQIANQELILPRVAPLLLRTHKHASQEAVDAFPVKFTDDASGMLLQAASFDPGSGVLTRPSFIVRDEHGRTTSRYWAAAAAWDAPTSEWVLSDGHVVHISEDGRGSTTARQAQRVGTDLSPTMLTMRRYGQVASMLSLGQINEMLRWPDSRDAESLRRSSVSRFAVVLLNVLVLMIALPFFLDRLPGGLFLKAIICAGVVLPMYFTAAGIMLVPIPGLSPLLGSALPVLVLLPIAMARIGSVKT